MAGRAGPFSKLFQILFALPFLGIGVFTFVIGVFGTGQSFLGVVFGFVFAGVGGYQIVQALRSGRSRESLGAAQGGLAAFPGAPLQGVGDYRSPASRERSAREVYAPVLTLAPLPKLTTHPGLVLPVALSAPANKGEYFGLAFAIVWLGLTGPIFLVGLASAQWGMVAFLSLFVVVGLVILVAVLRKLLARLKLPRVELSEEPVYLGDELRVYLEHRGPARIARLRVDLVCRERATHGTGSSAKTAVHEVLQRELLDAPGRTLARGERWQHDLRVVLPADAPHSFASPQNAIDWAVRLRAEIDGWPDYDERFELRALPRVPS